MINLDSTVFNISQKTMAPAGGRLLVSEPFLREQYFSHAVILLLEYDDNSTSMGLVLNNRMRYTLGELVEGIDSGIRIPVYCGGPVGGDRLFYLHTLGDVFEGSRRIAPGLWTGGDFDQVLEYVSVNRHVEGVIRFFIGYSGWEERQLSGEISNHVWAVTDIKPGMNLLQGSEDSYWHRMVRSLGPRYSGWRYHPAQIIAN